MHTHSHVCEYGKHLDVNLPIQPEEICSAPGKPILHRSGHVQVLEQLVRTCREAGRTSANGLQRTVEVHADSEGL
jgi:hypothetical protein